MNEQAIYELTGRDGSIESVLVRDNVATTPQGDLADLVLPLHGGIVEGKFTSKLFTAGDDIVYRGAEYTVDRVTPFDAAPVEKESVLPILDEDAIPSSESEVMVYNFGLGKWNVNLVLPGNKLQEFRLSYVVGDMPVFNGSYLYPRGSEVELSGLAKEGVRGFIRGSRKITLAPQEFLERVEESLGNLLDLYRDLRCSVEKVTPEASDSATEEELFKPVTVVNYLADGLETAVQGE